MSLTTQDTGLHWFALSVRGNKVFEARDELAPDCADTYVPVAIRTDASGHRVPAPAVSRLLFVRTTAEQVLALEARAAADPRRCQFFIYRNMARTAPQVIPEAQMRMFILVSSAGEADLVYLDPDTMPPYRTGQRVRVIEGIFSGAEGYVRRVRRDRRVVVEIEGLCAVALPFLHHTFLQPVNE